MSKHEALEIDLTDELRVWQERRDLWLYLRVPDAYPERLNSVLARRPRGFRSIPVTASLDGQPWRTALFRYADGTWALPVKKEIRHRHHLDIGLTAQVHLAIRKGGLAVSGWRG